GGVPALMDLVSRLPKNLAAALLIVVHTSPDGPGILPLILERAGPLKIGSAENAQPIVAGHIYVAPPDRHLLVKRGAIRLGKGPRENGFRPAVDPLFRTAAGWYGPRVVGIVLSGGLDDGTMGLLAIKEHGGTAIVQDPMEALFPSMPQSA